MSDRDRKSRFKGPKPGGRGGDRDRERHGERSGKHQGKPQGRPNWRDREAKGHVKGEGPVILYGWHSVTMALANPQRRKTRAGIRKFINRWLARAQDQGGSGPRPPVPVNPFLEMLREEEARERAEQEAVL